MSLKSTFFKLRDGLRFSWARSKYGYIPSGDIGSFDFHKLEHVVILKLDGKLGDTQVMSHFYSELRKLENESGRKLFLSVVCPKNLTHIYKDILGFDCVLECSRKPREPEINAICTQIKKAAIAYDRSEKVDLIISTEPRYRPRDFIFNKLLAPRYVAGCDKRLSTNDITQQSNAIAKEKAPATNSAISFLLYDVDTYDKPVSHAFVDFLKLGKVKPQSITYAPLCAQEEINKAAEYLAVDKTSIETNKVILIGVNPHGAAKIRTFSPQVTAGILSAIIDSSSSTKALLMCQRTALDYIHEVIGLLSDDKKELIGSRIILMPESSTVSDLCALIGNLSGLIGVDTATVHIACAFKMPQLCVYNNCSLNSKQWAPLGFEAKCIYFKDGDMPTTAPENIIEPAKQFIEEVLANHQ